LLTADVISSERREGTLILLFLTRVKSFDVLLGKLTSAGLTGFCALVACAPLLIIPILAGGVTGSEAVRKSMVLMNTMFVALTAGIWASAKGRGWFKRARAAVVVVGLIIVVPALVELNLSAIGWTLLLGGLLVAIGTAAGGYRWPAKWAATLLLLVCLLVVAPALAKGFFLASSGATTGVGLLSPLVSLVAAGDSEFRASHSRYWVSLGLVQAVGWALLVAARARLRRSLREDGDLERTEEATEKARRTESAANADGPPNTPTGRGKRLKWPLGAYRDPIEWLVEGQGGVKALVWTGAAVGFFQYGLLPFITRFIGFRASSILMWPLGFAVTVLQGLLFAAAASWFFVEARRSGELELLMTTPVGATTILSAQWNRLKRLFQWPAAVMAAPIPLIGLFSLMWYRGYPRGSMAGYILLNSLLSAVDVVFGIAAICWTGLWFGLKARSLTGAIIWTVGLGKGVPFLITILAQIVVSALINRFASANGGVVWLVILAPQVAILWYYMKLIQWARRRLAGQFAAAPVKGFRLNRSCEMAMTGVK
jgi:hypothetical protein